MSVLTRDPECDRELTGASAYGIHDALLTEVCSAMFRTLPRRDQRRKGMEYVFGLLAASGRKSIRNIAALFRRQAAEQSLHHFVCSSTWDWGPVRNALSEFVVRVAPPQAWVLRPMIIPKAGEHSVGVDRQFFADIGHVLNAQRAVGVWAASEELCTPVNWRLCLPRAWDHDRKRRARAALPDTRISETMSDCAINAFLDMMARSALPTRPVVLDARDLDATKVMRRMRAAHLPVLARIDGGVRLAVTDPALTGHHADVLPAHHIARAAKHFRRPVTWRDGSADALPRTRLVAGVRVRLPREVPFSSCQGDLLLLATAEVGKKRPAQLWLTNLTGTDLTALARLTTLVDCLEHNFANIADQVGVRDFAGRSFGGWHRHMTLASAAHVVSAITRRDNAVTSQVS
ncbi:transposase [Amycolatopsis sp. NPDC021455]|uniref:IS701 family transposase n=1 Tax=Amycolatopsis sp. NPDC021455 TaxID=3154901 RepID=UPI0033D4CE43